MNKKVKAFTMMELTVAMLLSALTIAITYTCYSIINKSYSSFEKQQQELSDVGQFTQLAAKDIDNAESIYRTDDGFYINKYQGGYISYSFTPDYVLRKSIAIDTFKIKTTGLTCYFEAIALTNQQPMEEQNRIDELSFDITYGDDKIPYYYFKSYSSKNLINRNSNAIN